MMKFDPKDRCGGFAEIDYSLKVNKLLNYYIVYVKPEVLAKAIIDRAIAIIKAIAKAIARARARAITKAIAKAITNTCSICKLRC